VTAQGCSLKMSQWHTCKTSHCIAGWVVTLAGAEGKALEDKVGTPHAARRIYYASDPKCRVPFFYETDDAKALAVLEANARKEAEDVTP
jgi:hypothetical protein